MGKALIGQPVGISAAGTRVLFVVHDGMLTTYRGEGGEVTTGPLSETVDWDTAYLDVVDAAEAHGRALDWYARNRYPAGVPVQPNEFGRPF